MYNFAAEWQNDEAIEDLLSAAAGRERLNRPAAALWG